MSRAFSALAGGGGLPGACAPGWYEPGLWPWGWWSAGRLECGVGIEVAVGDAGFERCGDGAPELCGGDLVLEEAFGLEDEVLEVEQAADSAFEMAAELLVVAGEEVPLGGLGAAAAAGYGPLPLWSDTGWSVGGAETQVSESRPLGDAGQALGHPV